MYVVGGKLIYSLQQKVNISVITVMQTAIAIKQNY